MLTALPLDPFYINQRNKAIKIIINFSSTVEEIDIDSNKFFKFQRFDGIREFSEKTIIPPPLVVIEYLYMILVLMKNYLTGHSEIKANCFRNALINSLNFALHI